MITAHFPSGYALARHLPRDRAVTVVAMIGAVFPDIDLIWFYWIDDRAFHHHHYWVHIPAFWLAIGAVVWPILRQADTRLVRLFTGFMAGLTLHLCLDAIAGGIAWGWPFTDQLYYLVDVPVRGGHWIWNFVLHPVFVLEMVIWIWAGWLVWNR